MLFLQKLPTKIGGTGLTRPYRLLLFLNLSLTLRPLSTDSRLRRILIGAGAGFSAVLKYSKTPLYKELRPGVPADLVPRGFGHVPHSSSRVLIDRPFLVAHGRSRSTKGVQNKNCNIFRNKNIDHRRPYTLVVLSPLSC